MRFDAYAGTIRNVDPEVVLRALAHSLAGTVEDGPRLRRYGQTLQIVREGAPAVWVGQDDGNDSVYFEGKGASSPLLAEAVRKHFPSHSVARADVCQDFDAPGAFSELQALIRAHKGAKTKGGYVRLPDDDSDGSTWAAGVRGAPTYVRLYEAGKMPERVHLGRPDWVRCELEARPHYAVHKQVSALLAPAEFWGLSRWASRVGQAVTGTEIPRVEIRHDSAKAGTWDYIARTFRRFLESELDAGVDAERMLRFKWQEQDAVDRAWSELVRTTSPGSRRKGG